MPLVPPPAPRRSSPAADVPSSAVLVANQPEWSVGDLASALKRTLEDAFGHVRLRGEISGFRGQHGSGHAYFSLKDGNARIDAVVWKGTFNRLRQKPQEGLEVVATGKITTFPGKSSYQIVIESLEPAGVGAWMALLEERKRALAAEGLFAAEHKRAIPFLPQVVGVVTSPTGAVIRDILHRLEDRFPRPVLVWPVRVQGEGAADEIAAAIRGFNALPPGGPIPRPDVLIVARGGGSIEDLWAFNEEAVVRAAFESRIPLISAVGHETDTTLIDFVSDRRAPTPTGAAEMAVPVRADLAVALDDLTRRRRGAVERKLDRLAADFRSALRAMPDADAFLAGKRQRLDLAEARLAPALAGNARAFRERFSRVLDRLARHPPELVLERARARLSAIDHRPRQALANHASRKGDALSALGHRLVVARTTTLRRAETEAARARERLAASHGRMIHAAAGLIERRRARLDRAGDLLGSLGYRAVLARGYVLVRDGAGAALRSGRGLPAGSPLSLEFADGFVSARTEADAGAPAPEGAPSAKRGPAPAKQGAAPAKKRAPRRAKAAPEVEPPAPAAAQGSLFEA
ncbi:exodeoxyribonuclease VII large subunit [Methylobacterium sp. WL12]|uniref:exodeoxyribonuclease VII large subunit n=2 Tax=unclassified Methylobacterium TaxID=2615210 RepID=UPI0011CB64FF|nr:exodeoxyribonuclease VII large subunit [Methylobacterium sp. WL12]TXM64196.1 exodeoxyribonuclease VII large subunit [Methylobacterium sp. WL12]